MIVTNVAFATITLTAINNVLSEIANTMYWPRQKCLRFYVTCTLHLSTFDICAKTRIIILPLGHVIAD